MKPLESDRPGDQNGVDLLGIALELLGAPDPARESDPTPAVVEPSEEEEAGVEDDNASLESPFEATAPKVERVVSAIEQPTGLGPAPRSVPSRTRLNAPKPSDGPEAVLATPRASQPVLARFRATLARSAGLQFVLLAAAGTGILIAWTVFDRPLPPEDNVRAAPAEADSVPKFPKLDVPGVDRVREEDVQALFEPKPPAKTDPAPELASGAEGASPRGVVVLKPGQLADEHGNVTDLSGHKVVPARAVIAPRPVAAEPAVGGGRFFMPGGLLTGASSAPAVESVLPLRVGERVRVKLEVGVVSSVREDVLARVLEDVVRDGRRILGKGDMLRGSASHDDKRIFLRFRTAETAGRSLELSAYAVDGTLPGLVARRREATVEERTRAHAASNVIGGVAAEAGAALSGAAAVGRIAERVANGAASEAASAMEPDRAWVLEISAGRTFEVVVTEARKP